MSGLARENKVRYINMYMAGSAAYQLEPVKPQKKAVRLPKAPKQKRVLVYVDPMTILGFAVALVMIVSMAAGVMQLNKARSEEAVLEAYVARLEQENEKLAETYREGYDLDEIRRYAEAMGLVPMSQVERIEIQVLEPAAPAEPTAWENFRTFLVGLFA